MAKRKPEETTTSIAALTPDPENARRHPRRNVEMMTASLKTVGAARSIVIDENNVVLAGNGMTAAAKDAGVTKVRIIDADGDELIAVRRAGLTPSQKRELALYDNRTGELAEWNAERLLSLKDAGADLRPFWTEEEEAALASLASAEEVDRLARLPSAAEVPTPEGAGPPAPDYQTFSCALTIDQERIVRAALRTARAKWSLDTTGNALTAVLKAWADEEAARG